MRSIFLAATASMLALGSAPTMPAHGQAAAAAAPTTAAAFLEAATSVSLFEIQASELALQVSQNPAIRTFAQTAIDERKQMLSDVIDAAQRSGVAMPAQTLLPHHQQMLAQLRALPAGQFDAVYRQFQLSAHREAVDLFRGYAAGGDTPIIRETADRWGPCIGAHQEVMPMVHPGERG